MNVARRTKGAAAVAALVLAPGLGACSLDLPWGGCSRPLYESVVRLHVTAQPVTQEMLDRWLITRRTTNYAQLATSREILQRMRAALSPAMTLGQLSEAVRASMTGTEEDALLTVRVRASAPALAQKVARLDAGLVSTYLSELEITQAKATTVSPASYVADRVACRS
jgi:capsular polysaccharide biosynthesis protein